MYIYIYILLYTHVFGGFEMYGNMKVGDGFFCLVL